MNTYSKGLTKIIIYFEYNIRNNTFLRLLKNGALHKELVTVKASFLIYQTKNNTSRSISLPRLYLYSLGKFLVLTKTSKTNLYVSLYTGNSVCNAIFMKIKNRPLTRHYLNYEPILIFLIGDRETASLN
jgi:hypothetical protein